MLETEKKNETQEAYEILHDALTTYYNDKLQDTNYDARLDAVDVENDFKLVLPFVHKLEHTDLTHLDLAYNEFEDAKLQDDEKAFKNNMNNTPLAGCNIM